MEDSDEETETKKAKVSEKTELQNKPIDELAQYRQILRDKKKAIMEKPKVYLLLDELQFQHSRQMSQDLTFKELPPLFLLDLQHLLLFALQGNVSSYKPRWCRLLRVGKVTSVVVMVLDGVSSYEFQTYPDCFPRLKAEFEMSVDMVSPEQYGSTVSDDLFNVPLSNSVLVKTNGYKSLKRKVINNVINKFTKPPGFQVMKKETVNVDKMSKKQKAEMTDKKEKSVMEEKDDEKEKPVNALSEDNQMDCTIPSVFFTNFNTDVSELHKNDKFPRTSLLLSSEQMIAEDFPVPIQYGTEGTYKEYVFSKDVYATVTNQSPLFAVDCEMCITTAKKYELTRVSVINEDLQTVYDSFVKPYNRITDYVSRFSGVTKHILDPVKTRLEDVQKFLQKTLPPDAILCGQSLKGDLAALQMFHPYVIDTSVIFNLSGHRSKKTGLKRLSAHFLGKTIQDSDEGHSSVEDAVTTMELIQLKLSQSPHFGDILNSGPIFPQKVEQTGENSSSSDKTDNSESFTKIVTSESAEETEAVSNQPSVDRNQINQTDDRQNITDVNKMSSSKSKKKEKNSDENPDKCDSSCSCSDATCEDNAICEKCGGNSTENRTERQESPLELRKRHENLIQQRKAFFQIAGSQVFESFFKLLKKHNKAVGLIDRPAILEQYKDDTMTAIPTNCDRDTKSAGKSLTQFHDFVYMNFPSFRDNLESSEEEDKLKLLRKQDKRMSKVLQKVRVNSLVAVVMTGRCQNGQDFSAKTFVKIT